MTKADESIGAKVALEDKWKATYGPGAGSLAAMDKFLGGNNRWRTVAQMNFQQRWESLRAKDPARAEVYLSEVEDMLAEASTVTGEFLMDLSPRPDGGELSVADEPPVDDGASESAPEPPAEAAAEVEPEPESEPDGAVAPTPAPATDDDEGIDPAVVDFVPLSRQPVEPEPEPRRLRRMHFVSEVSVPGAKDPTAEVDVRRVNRALLEKLRDKVVDGLAENGIEPTSNRGIGVPYASMINALLIWALDADISGEAIIGESDAAAVEALRGAADNARWGSMFSRMASMEQQLARVSRDADIVRRRTLTIENDAMANGLFSALLLADRYNLVSRPPEIRDVDPQAPQVLELHAHFMEKALAEKKLREEREGRN